MANSPIPEQLYDSLRLDDRLKSVSDEQFHFFSACLVLAWPAINDYFRRAHEPATTQPERSGDAVDAARYRGLQRLLYSQNFDIGEAELSLHFYGAAPTFDQFDAAIDAAMLANGARPGEEES